MMNSRLMIYKFTSTGVGGIRYFSKLGQGRIVSIEAQLSKSIGEIIEPITKKHLVDVGCLRSVNLKEGGELAVVIDTLVPGYMYKDEIELKIRNILRAQDIPHTSLRLEYALPPTKATEPSKSNLSMIKHIVGVSSCKGGVGKSTVAVNIACTLSLMGLKVGILDADVYGPSLPYQLEALDKVVRPSKLRTGHIGPLQAKDIPNLSMLSFGHVNPKSGAPGSGGSSAALMRGPIATKVINQMLLCTEWGNLDYLIVDMPPGTGDIQITLSQTAQLSGAIIISTPHLLSVVDAKKGIHMFNSVGVPTLSYVENMSYFTCKHGENYFPFGRGGKEKLLQGLGVISHNPETDESREVLKRIPYFALPFTDVKSSSDYSNEPSSDENTVDKPISLRKPDSDASGIYKNICASMIQSLFTFTTSQLQIPSIQLDKSSNTLKVRYFTESSASEWIITPKELLESDPHTGQLSHVDLSVLSQDILSLEHIGMYGIGIRWKESYCIYSLDAISAIIKRNV